MERQPVIQEFTCLYRSTCFLLDLFVLIDISHFLAFIKCTHLVWIFIYIITEKIMIAVV